MGGVMPYLHYHSRAKSRRLAKITDPRQRSSAMPSRPSKVDSRHESIREELALAGIASAELIRKIEARLGGRFIPRPWRMH